jgi:hypothetical protein
MKNVIISNILSAIDFTNLNSILEAQAKLETEQITIGELGDKIVIIFDSHNEKTFYTTNESAMVAFLLNTKFDKNDDLRSDLVGINLVNKNDELFYCIDLSDRFNVHSNLESALVIKSWWNEEWNEKSINM